MDYDLLATNLYRVYHEGMTSSDGLYLCIFDYQLDMIATSRYDKSKKMVMMVLSGFVS